MRKRPSQGRSRTTVTSILEAADRILRNDGYEAASTNRVARVAGFSVGSLYQYFRDKQAIVGALLDRELGAEGEALVQLLDAGVKSRPGDLVAASTRFLIERRSARAHLYRTLDSFAGELGVASALVYLVQAQAPSVSDALQRVAAQTLPRSARGLDARLFALSRTLSSAAFSFSIDPPAGVDAALLTSQIAPNVERYLAGPPPSPRVASLVLGWSKLHATHTPSEMRSRRRREARAVLIGAGVEPERLEARAFLLACVAEASAATSPPPFGMSQEDALHELARFAEALGA